MPSLHRVRTTVTHLLAVIGLAAGLGAWSAPPASAAAPSTIDLIGHGWGHGRGMGQWGAFGYAKKGWSAGQILQHFYGRTTPGVAGSQEVPIRLENLDGADLIAQATAGLRTSATGGALYAAARVRRTGSSTWAVDHATSCAGPWTQAATSGSPITLSPTVDTNAAGASFDQMLQACQPNATIRWYRGTLTGAVVGSTRIAVNTLDLERYLVSVVGTEVSPAWADLGGAAALQAQAVAARSYVLAENRGLPTYRTADALLTSCCQAYSGAAVKAPNSARQSREDPRTVSAVDSTAGQVRIFNGAPARTEYSASTGGWTVASTHSDAVVDEGDAVSTPGSSAGTNPRHTWRAAVPRSAIEAGFAPGATLLDIAVTARNGLGDLGGRVTQVRMQFTSGVVEVSGTAFKNKLYCNCASGPLSDWFAFGSSTTPSGGVTGYWIADSAGGVFSFGKAAFHGSAGGLRLNHPILGIAGTPSGGGYWMVASDGGIFAYGDARFFGSTGNIRLNRPVVGMAPTPSGNGYWMVASDGGIFAYGDAGFFGSTGSIRLNQPVVGMAPTPSGRGYWLVARDGGIFAYGDAPFYGSTGAIRLNQPIVAMASTPSAGGYWMVAADGGIFAFGTAPYHGSMPARRVPGQAVSISSTRTGGGYLVSVADGSVQSFGDAPAMGGIGSVTPGWRGRAVGLSTVAT